jgi:uncharacterized phage-associated protein
MAVRARVVANEFIRLARADERYFTPLQLIKLVYIAHVFQSPLITDRVEAWKYGPVIPDLHHAMKGYRAASVYQSPLIPDRVEAWKYGPVIPDLYDAMKGNRAAIVTDFLPGGSTDELDEKELELIRRVYDAYGRSTGVQLVSPEFVHYLFHRLANISADRFS